MSAGSGANSLTVDFSDALRDSTRVAAFMRNLATILADSDPSVHRKLTREWIRGQAQIEIAKVHAADPNAPTPAHALVLKRAFALLDEANEKLGAVKGMNILSDAALRSLGLWMTDVELLKEAAE